MNKKLLQVVLYILCFILVLLALIFISQNKKYRYNSIETFADDVSEDDIGKGVVRTEPTFIAYEKDDKYYVELLSDITVSENCIFENTEIDLRGYNITLEADITLNNSKIKSGVVNVLTGGERNIVTLSNSSVDSIHFNIIGDGGKIHIVEVTDNAELTNCVFSAYGNIDELRFLFTEESSVTKVSGCAFITDFNECNRVYAINGNGELDISDSNFFIKSNSNKTDGRVYSGGIYQYHSVMKISNCDIKVENYAKYGVSYGIVIGKNTETANIIQCNIYADSHYLRLGDSYGSLSQGLTSRGLDVNVIGCTVRGVHSAMQVGGRCYVEDSHFESTGHGGIYFVRSGRKDENDADMSATYVVKNSEICWCEPSGIFKEDIGKEDCSGDNKAAFYIGGSDYASNITVYMIGCTVRGNKYSGVLRGTSNERQNTLYISDTNMDRPMRIDKVTLEMYVGIGCNITEESEVYWQHNLMKYNEAEDIGVFFDEIVDYSDLF